MSQCESEAREAHQVTIVKMDPTWEKVLGNIKTYQNRKRPAEPSIFKVPEVMRSRNPHAYEPKLVSIGPYHHGKPSLQAMEDIKWQILDHLLSKASEDGIHQCFKKMQDIQANARSYYSEVIDMNDDKFAEMLLLDGCFVMQLSIPCHLQAEEIIDLLSKNIWIQVRLLQDLLLLENQVPYFIFEHLRGALNIPELEDFDFRDSILKNLRTILPILGVSTLPEPKQEVAHLLHLLHYRILSMPWKKESNASPLQIEPSIVVPSVTQLMEAGVKIRVRDVNNFLDISFHEGKLEIPKIQVDDHTNLVFRNLIALEQFRKDVGTKITCYSVFMDAIINTGKDVALLSQKRIIDPALGSDVDVASLFNELCNDVTLDVNNNYLGRLFNNVNAYCDSRWNRWRARLMHDYFSNPWAIISVIAAAVLLVLTVVQTLFSVLSYTQ